MAVRLIIYANAHSYSHSPSYELAAVESALTSQQVPGDPSDITYLRSHLRELPDDARTYIIWASFFGSVFKATDVTLVMDRDDSSGSQSEEDEHDWNPRRTNQTDGMSRASVNGLQTAIAEGWVIQRGREMCSFTHDAYRHAAEREADELPDGFVAKMSFRILMVSEVELDSLVLVESDFCLIDHARRAGARHLPDSEAHSEVSSQQYSRI